MRVLLMMTVAACVIWAASSPDRVLDALGDASTHMGRATDMLRIRESEEELARRRSAYEAWQKEPTYDIDTLERLWADTGNYMVLLHLAEATMQGCGSEYESAVLEANRDLLMPHDFISYRRLKALKHERCAQSQTRRPSRGTYGS